MTSAIDCMEAGGSAALARYLQAVGDGMPRRDAERAYRDQIRRAYERTQLAQARHEAQLREASVAPHAPVLTDAEAARRAALRCYGGEQAASRRAALAEAVR